MKAQWPNSKERGKERGLSTAAPTVVVIAIGIKIHCFIWIWCKWWWWRKLHDNWGLRRNFVAKRLGAQGSALQHETQICRLRIKQISHKRFVGKENLANPQTKYKSAQLNWKKYVCFFLNSTKIQLIFIQVRCATVLLVWLVWIFNESICRLNSTHFRQPLFLKWDT